MPLLPGKKNIGHNIKVEEEAGKPQKQAAAIALSKAEGKDALAKWDSLPLAKRMSLLHDIPDAEVFGEGVGRKAFSSLPIWVQEELDGMGYGYKHAKDADPTPIPIKGEDRVLGRGAVGDDLRSVAMDALQTYIPKLNRDDTLRALRTYIAELKKRGIPQDKAVELANKLYANVKRDVEKYGQKPAKDRVLGRGAVGDDRMKGKDTISSADVKYLQEVDRLKAALGRAKSNSEYARIEQKLKNLKEKYNDLQPIPMAKDRVLGRGAVGDDLMSQREEENLNKALRKNPKGIEAYGVKGFKNTQWRKVFKSAEAMEKWCDQNDAEVQGTRDVAQDSLRPVPVDDETKYAERPSKPHFIGSMALPNKEDVDRVYGGKRSAEGFKKTFGKDGYDEESLRLGKQRAERTNQIASEGDRSRVRIALAGYYSHPAVDPDDEAAYSALVKVGAKLGLTRFGNEKAKDADPAPVRVNNPMPVAKTVPVSKKARDEEDQLDREDALWIKDLVAEGKSVAEIKRTTGFSERVIKAVMANAPRMHVGDSAIRKMAQDAFHGRNIARGPGEMSRANDAAAKASLRPVTV